MGDEWSSYYKVYAIPEKFGGRRPQINIISRLATSYQNFSSSKKQKLGFRVTFSARVLSSLSPTPSE